MNTVTFEKQRVTLRVSKPPVVGEGMRGIVVEHPFHPPGTEVVTTKVLSITEDFVETRHSIYTLV